MVCRYPFPSDGASAIRVYTLGKLLRSLGYSVSLVGVDMHGNKHSVGECYGFPYRNIVASETQRISILSNIKWIRYLQKEIRSVFTEYDPCGVVLTGMEGFILDRVIRLCRKNRIWMANNVVEWYDRGDFHGLRDAVKFLRNRWSLIFLNKKTRNIIAISRYLESYYTKSSCHVIRIPAIVDPAKYTQVQNAIYTETRKMVFAYAGNPGTKDSVLNFLTAASELPPEKLDRIEIRLYGVTEKTLLGLGISAAVLSKLQGGLVCFGVIPHEEIKTRIGEADFTLLVRPDRRSSHAGFPTKLAESFACGVPVLANLTSDLGEYLTDGENAVICQDNSIQECRNAIIRILNFPESKINEMKAVARKTSAQFDYRNYCESMKQFVSSF